MRKLLILLTCFLLSATYAGDVYRIFDDGDDTVSIQFRRSFDRTQPLATNELARKLVPYELPEVDAKYYAWDGTNVVEASQAVKDAVDAAEAAAEEAEQEETADFEQMDQQLKALSKTFAQEINALRVRAGWEAYSAAEWKALVKDNL